MDLSLLLGLDPVGREAVLLCLMACLVFLALAALGFTLLWHAKRRGLAPHDEVDRREPGLVALWRMERGARRP